MGWVTDEERAKELTMKAAEVLPRTVRLTYDPDLEKYEITVKAYNQIPEHMRLIMHCGWANDITGRTCKFWVNVHLNAMKDRNAVSWKEINRDGTFKYPSIDS